MVDALYRRWRRATACDAAVIVFGAIAGCGGAKFKAGDCVSIELAGLRGHELKAADCESACGTFNPHERIYHVDSIIEGAAGDCPPLQGFFSVQFTHEPDNVIYCLVQAEG